MMKILWISPWFGNYRIPVYDQLNKLCKGNFYLICSQENSKHSKKCTFYTLRFGCSFAAVNTIKPQLL